MKSNLHCAKFLQFQKIPCLLPAPALPAEFKISRCHLAKFCLWWGCSVPLPSRRAATSHMEPFAWIQKLKFSLLLYEPMGLWLLSRTMQLAESSWSPAGAQRGRAWAVAAAWLRGIQRKGPQHCSAPATREGPCKARGPGGWLCHHGGHHDGQPLKLGVEGLALQTLPAACPESSRSCPLGPKEAALPDTGHCPT